MHIEVISDVICPWCFIGKRHLTGALALLAEDGLNFTVSWRPFQLNPEMPAEGIARAMYRAAKFGSAERARELDENVRQAGSAVGLEFRFDLMERTPNTIQAHRLIRLAAEQGVQNEMVEDLFQAYFQLGRDIGDAAVLAEIGARHGVDLLRRVGDDGVAAVRAEDEAARRAGLDGVPSFLMEGYFLFSGAMPADAMASQFRRAQAVLASRAA
jgi:predicted DsbA family dithiol-disulfide isomerase